MPILIGLGIGAATGAVKHLAVDAPNARKKTKLDEATERYSWLTGQHAPDREAPNLFGTMAAFGATGAQMGTGIQNTQSNNALRDSMTQFYQKGGANSNINRFSPWTQLKTAPAPTGPRLGNYTY